MITNQLSDVFNDNAVNNVNNNSGIKPEFNDNNSRNIEPNSQNLLNQIKSQLFG